jgi:hypothetical protein
VALAKPAVAGISQPSSLQPSKTFAVLVLVLKFKQAVTSRLDMILNGQAECLPLMLRCLHPSRHTMRFLAIVALCYIGFVSHIIFAQSPAPAVMAVPLKAVQGVVATQAVPVQARFNSRAGSTCSSCQCGDANKPFIPQIKTIDEFPQVFMPAGQLFLQAIEQSPRMQRLKSLQFSRKPTAVLKAWNPTMGEIKPNVFVDPQMMMMRGGGGMPMMNEPDAEANKANKTPEQKRLDEQLERFQNNVALGNWAQVRTYLTSLTGPETKAAYRQLLRSLASPQMSPSEMQAQNMGRPILPQVMEKNLFYTDDLIQLVALAPGKLEKGPSPFSHQYPQAITGSRQCTRNSGGEVETGSIQA